MKLVAVPVALLALSTLAACGSDDGSADGGSGASTDGRPVVVASTNVWGDIASQVGGDLVDVTSIIDDPSQDPHDFEADPDTLLTLSEADVAVENGGGFDDFMDTMLSTAGTDAVVVNAFDTSGKADAAPEGEEVNEHVWYDVATVGAVADQIATALGEADPDNAATYTANADAFQGELDGLTTAIDALRPTTEGRPYGITEPLPIYLADALGMVDQTSEEFAEAVEEGEDVPVGVLQETLDQIASGAIDLQFYNLSVTSPVTEQVKTAVEDAGIPIVDVSELLPADTSYVAWMQGNIDAISAAVSAA